MGPKLKSPLPWFNKEKTEVVAEETTTVDEQTAITETEAAAE